MSSRLYEYWENYSNTHDDNMNLYFGTEDFTMNGKFLFLDKKMKLSGKVKFNTEKNDAMENYLATTIEHSLTHTVNPWTKYTISQKPNKFILDGNFCVWKNLNHYFSLLAVANLEQDMKSRSMPTKAHLRYHYKNNALLSFGFEKYDLLSKKEPEIFSLISMWGKEFSRGYKLWGGCNTKVNVHDWSLLSKQYLLSLKYKDITGLLEFGLTKEDKKVQEDSSMEEKSIAVWKKSLCLKFDGKPHKNFALGGDMTYNFENHSVDTKYYGIYDVDWDTQIKGKWHCSERLLNLSIRHTFRGFLTFGVAARFQCDCRKVKENEISTGHCVKKKFGIFAELNDNFA